MKISIPYIMRYRIQVILVLFPAILWGCNFHKKNQQADSDFKILEQEQIEAQHHEGLIPPFRQVIKDFQEFKTKLYSAIKEKYVSRFRKYEIDKIKKLLTGSTPDNKYPSDAGMAILSRFCGQWTGQWFQNGEMSRYDQIWSQPYAIGDSFVAQKVIIRKYSKRRQKYINDKVAINSYNPKNHLFLGGVDVKRPERKGAYAPHLGFLIDSSTLVWIACFGSGLENPSYSFFYEKITPIDQVNHYIVRGVGFKWDRRSKRIVNINWREGHYVQVGPMASPSFIR